MVEIKHIVEIKGDGGASNARIRELEEALEEAQEDAEALRKELKQLGSEQTKKSLKGITDAIKGLGDAQKLLTDNAGKMAKSSENVIKSVKKTLEASVAAIKKASDAMSAGKTAKVKDFRIADRTLGDIEDKLSERQWQLLEKQLKNLGEGKISTNEFGARAAKISKLYSQTFEARMDASTITKDQRQHLKDKMAHDERMEEINLKYVKENNKEVRERVTLQEKLREQAEKAAEALKKDVELNKIAVEYQSEQAKYKTREGERQEQSKSAQAEAKATNERYKAVKSYIKAKEAYDSAEAKETRRQQKLAQNERARATLYQQLGEVMSGEYDDISKSTQKAELASKRLLETMRHIQEFQDTEGYTGTVGLESTDVLRAQQYYNTIKNLAIEWKRNNSEEGKAADLLGRMLVDAEGFRSGVNRIHTALGQLASTVSAITGVAKQLRQTVTRMLQPVIQMVSRLTSSAFKSALEALKNIELSEIGFGNFFGEYAVSGIMNNIKQNALLSPMSAAQLASYVNQIAPLSNGNATLATNAAMGVAKMIQYSGGEVSTEMEYIIRNLRDVISKGKATSIDIRQFNRAMPALKKVLQDMGLEEFLKEGELSISKETAPKLLEVFQRINESEDVGSIFDKTSLTISGLMERVQEQVELLLIDVADFSDATRWIKQTLSDILDDSDGLITDVKYFLSFVGNNVMRWLKSRDWERVAKTIGEIFDILKEAVADVFSSVKEALGGKDTASTIKDIAKAISEFIKGIGRSYSWLINLIKGLSNSGLLGSGILQGGMGIMGFLSGNAGTVITGLLRAAGTAMGVFNQAIFAVIIIMKTWQGKLLEAATSISGFNEAILLASRASADLAADFALMQQMMNGTITVEEMKQQMERAGIEARARDRQIEASSLDRLLEARSRNIASEEAETAVNKAAVQSELAESGVNGATATGGGVLAALFGKSGSGKGTKVGAALGTLFKGAIATMIAGSVGNLIGSGIGSLVTGGNEYGSKAGGASLGNLAGGAVAGGTIGSLIAPGIGTAIGAIVGGVGGLVKTVFDIKGIMDEKRKAELEALESEVNSGEYVRELLSKTVEGQRVTSGDFDKINSAAVALMHQFNDAFPNGTADALLTFLGEMEYNGRTIKEIVEASNKDREKNANDLWYAIVSEAIDKDTGDFLANEIAEGLRGAGYDSSDIASMVLEKATEAFNAGQITYEKLLDVMTQWTDVQRTSGADLSRDYLLDLKKKMEAGDKEAEALFGSYVTRLKTKYREIMAEVLKDVPESEMSSTEKTALSEQMADTWVDLITNSLDLANKDGIFSLTRFFQQAGIDSKNNPFNLGITDQDVANLDDYKIKLYGINNNWDTWSQKLYIFGEGVTRYSDKITERMKVFYNVADSTIPKLDELAGSLRNVRDAAGQTGLEGIKQYELPHKSSGGIVYRAAGGDVRGVDTVHAMLQAGEYVVRKSAVDKIGLSAMNALNTGNIGYFARALGRQNIYGDYSNARTWNSTSNDNRKSVRNIVKVYNNSKGARLNRYYSLANRLA